VWFMVVSGIFWLGIGTYGDCHVGVRNDYSSGVVRENFKLVGYLSGIVGVEFWQPLDE